MNTYYSDPAQPLRFVIRVNRVNEFVFSFIQDSLPWQIGYNEFEFLVKRYAGERSNLLRLTIGDGLTIDGNELSGIITELQSNITEGLYYWELYRPDIKKTWVSGDLKAINGVPEVDENTSTITVNEEGDVIQITVNGGGGGGSGDVSYTEDGDITVFEGTARELNVGAELLENSSTGLYIWTSPGFAIASSTEVTVSAGEGHITINTSDDEDDWTYTRVTWLQQTVSISNDGISYIYIDSSGVAQVTTTELTRAQRKQNIFLGQAIRRVGTVSQVIPIPDFILYPANQIHEILDVLGLQNFGVTFTPNGANLRLNRNGTGSLLIRGGNFFNDKLNANEVLIPAAVPVTFAYRTQDINVLPADTTFVDPLNYDVGGVITSIPGSNSRASIQYIYQFPPTAVAPTGNVRILYGQNVYNSLTAAIQALDDDNRTRTVNALIPGNAVLIATIILTKGCTSLSDTTTCRIFPANPTGQVVVGPAGVSVTSLQQAYQNSETPEVVTDSTRGAVTVRRGSTADNDNIIEGQNGAGSTTFSVNGNGDVTLNDEVYSPSWSGKSQSPTKNAIYTKITDLEGDIAGAALDDPTLTQFLTRVSGDSGTTENIQFATDKTDQLRYIRIASKLRWLITANAYKANKVYAILPFNSGNGDPSFTRTSVANRIKLDGTLEALASGVPQIDYRYGSEPVILVEPACVNLLTNPAAPATQNVAVTAQPYTLSFYGTGTITLSGAATGSLVGTGANTRVILTFTPSAGTLTLTVSGSVVNAQLEARNHATSEAIAATRNTGTLTVSDIFTKGFIGNGQGTFYFRVKDNTSKIRGAVPNIIEIVDSVSTDSLGARRALTGSRLQITKRVGGTFTTLYTTLTDEVAVAFVWNGTLASIFVNGVKVVTNTAITSVNYNSFGVAGGSGVIAIKDSWLSPYALSDDELIDATNLDGVANSRIINTVLNNLDTSDSSDVTSEDSIVEGIGKLQAQNNDQDTKLGYVIYPEDYGATGDGVTDDLTALQNYWAQLCLINNIKTGSSLKTIYLQSETINLTSRPSANFQGTIKATGGTLTTSDYLYDATIQSLGLHDFKIDLDGNNKQCNGIVIRASVQRRGTYVISSNQCVIGTHLIGNVEIGDYKIFAYNCNNGIIIENGESSPGNSATPDELNVMVITGSTDTAFHVRGTEKTSGHCFLLTEGVGSKTLSYDPMVNPEIKPELFTVIQENGSWTYSGEIRGSRGGIRVGANALHCFFNGLIMYGGINLVNYAIEIDSNICAVGGTVILFGWENGGVWIKRTQPYTGSLKILRRDVPIADAIGLKLGDAANSKIVRGFVLEDGSALSGTTIAMDLDNATDCKLYFSRSFGGGGIRISSTSSNNTIYISFAERARTITNNRTENDNKIIYTGIYNNAQLEEINGGTFFKGMEVEGSADATVYGRLFWNGTNWESANGLTYNTVTNTWS